MDYGVNENVVFYQVNVHCFVCNAVACQCLKTINIHVLKFVCQKCTVQGVYSRTHKTMSSQDLYTSVTPLLTDGSFILQSDLHHHSSIEHFPPNRIGVCKTY